MFLTAFLVGSYGYLIFIIGLLGILYKTTALFATTVYFLTLLFIYKKTLLNNLRQYLSVLKKFSWNKSRLISLLVTLLTLQVLVNVVGALGPELAFDALWYHLTLPKLYLEYHSIFFIPGGLLYYSAMPKLIEMLYVGALAFGSDIFAKLIHFSFGLLTLVVLYSVSRRFLSKTLSLLVIVLFYSNLVVGWMSITAYVDLGRTFFELMAFWAFFIWYEKREKRWLLISSLMLGFAISSKLLALGSILIFLILIIYISLEQKRKLKNLLVSLFAYLSICLLVPLPWFIFSFIHTGNPVYPFFTDTYPVKPNFEIINPLTLSDPISPLYLVILPLAVFIYKKLKKEEKIIFIYSFLAIFIWFVTPQTGGGRFLLPYLPAISLISIITLQYIRIIKIKRILIGLIIFFAFFSIFYRGAANYKYIPVVLGIESKDKFLSNNLSFNYGDFYDTDGYFKNNIKEDDKVLLYGFHNLYYVNFPFTDSSFAKRGEKFNYIAVQDGNIPDRFIDWELIYYNKITGVELFTNGGKEWEY